MLIFPVHPIKGYSGSGGISPLIVFHGNIGGLSRKRTQNTFSRKLGWSQSRSGCLGEEDKVAQKV
jgi:hypothetical protein